MRVKSFAESYGADMLVIALILSVLLVFAVSCGKESDPYQAPPPARPERPAPGGDAAWDELKPLVQANCGGCHNGTTHPVKFDSGAAFKRSKAKARITNGTMPPSGALDPEVKAKMLAYLG